MLWSSSLLPQGTSSSIESTSSSKMMMDLSDNDNDNDNDNENGNEMRVMPHQDDHADHAVSSSSPFSFVRQEVFTTFMTVPLSVRTYILNFLSPDSLLESSLLSKQLYQECHSGVGIEHPIIPVFRISPKVDNSGVVVVGSTQQFLQQMQKYQQHQHDDDTYQKVTQRYGSMEVIDIDKFTYSIGHVLFQMIHHNPIQMQGVFLLNISRPFFQPQPHGHQGHHQHQPQYEHLQQPQRQSIAPSSCSLAIALSGMLPNLRELNLSNMVSGSTCGIILQQFTQQCPLLETLICNHNSHIYADGSEIQAATKLTEIRMDDCTFISYCKNPTIRIPNNNINDDNDNNMDITTTTTTTPTPFLFHCWNSTVLERVSIRNAKYYVDSGDGNDGDVDDNDHDHDHDENTTTNIPILLPEDAIMKYIRNGAPPSLKWFRCSEVSLSSTNKKVLQVEQPGIKFWN